MVAHRVPSTPRVADSGRHSAGADKALTAHWRLVRVPAALIGFYSLAVALGCALFVAFAKSGVFDGIAVLFYRGIVELVTVAPALLVVLMLVLRLPWPVGILAGRDAVVGTVLAISLNLAGFVVGPVTVDRSISVFLLSRLATAQSPLTAADVAAVFADQYVCEWDQIGRRLKEQMAIGNIEQIPAGYRLTPQGHSFIRAARMTSQLFGADPRFVGMERPVGVAARDGRGASTCPAPGAVMSPCAPQGAP